MKILVADDHSLVREGIICILEESFPFAEIEGVSNAEELLQRAEEQWNVIITDISMPPGNSALEAITKIKELSPATPVIVMSMHTAEEYAVRVMKAGAKGYLTKDAASEELVKAVNQVLSGRKYLNENVSFILADAFENGDGSHSTDKLSERELEVFKLLASGKLVSAIAKELGLSPNTISTFRARVLEKMNFNNNMELIKYAVDKQII